MKEEKKERASPADEILSKIDIDYDDLMGSAITQVQLMARLSVLLAEAQRRASRADERVKTIRSQKILELHKNPVRLGEGVSLNMQTAEAWYRVHPEYVEAVKAKQEREYEASILQSLMFTLAHRRSVLEIMAKARSAVAYGDRDLPLPDGTPTASLLDIQPTPRGSAAHFKSKASREADHARLQRLMKEKKGLNPAKSLEIKKERK